MLISNLWEPELEVVAIEEDEAVQRTQEALSYALAELSTLEALERRYISILDGTAQQPVGNDEFQEAQDRIAVRPGTHRGFLLPDAEKVRRRIPPLRQAHDAAIKAAKDRLNQAWMIQLKTLCGELSPLLIEAMKLAEKIEVLRLEIGQGGGDIDVHPFPVLLPGGLLAGQLEIARGKDLL